MALTYEIIDRSTEPPTPVAVGLTEDQAMTELKRLRREAIKTVEVTVPEGSPVRVDGELRQAMTTDSIPVVGNRGKPRQYDIRPDYTSPVQPVSVKLFSIREPDTMGVVFETDEWEDFRKAVRKFIENRVPAAFVGGDPDRIRQVIARAWQDFPEPPPKEPTPLPVIAEFAGPGPEPVMLNEGEAERSFEFTWQIETAAPAQLLIAVNGDIKNGGEIYDDSASFPESWSEEFGPGAWVVQLMVTNEGGQVTSDSINFTVMAFEPEPEDRGDQPIEPENVVVPLVTPPPREEAIPILKQTIGWTDEQANRFYDRWANQSGGES